MNESTVIILFVAANPSKDISISSKIFVKQEEMERVDRKFQSIDQNQTQTPAGIWVF